MPNTQPKKYTIEQPIVFLPGTLCDERIFNACWHYLDIPMRAFVPLQWAEDLAQMKMLTADRLAYFDDKVHLVGFSMGAYIAAMSALENSSRIKSLTLIASTAGEFSELDKKSRQQTLNLIKNKQYKGMSDKRLEQFFHPANQKNGELKTLVSQMEQDLGAGVLTAQYRATTNRANLIPKLAKTKFQINLIAGESDNFVSKQSFAAMSAALPNANSQVIKNAGHMIPIEQPELLAKYLAENINTLS
ncbi:alpha/beta hydrolase [Paraglaciecola aquimarina]|uniref:Alpha/beta hydrolase n=1 Tax=Paraglaciecola algarum TaxID=3050085 RepID=A0ABS9D8Y3_9ALTE|nr:alpha/beta hydrolase [Paraglaciecola sp. G1-23]MCF2949255.1 alpha/beta hydrolase [Paraglaciecola sp. G1-23]